MVGLILTVAILWWADFGKIYRNILSFDYVLVIEACLLQVITIILLNIQWYTISIQMGEKIPFKRILNINMAGTFTESITPSVKAGGELAKIIMLKNEIGLSGSKATAIVGVQKVVSFISFLALNLISIFWFLTTTNIDKPYITRIIIISFIALILIFGFIIIIMVYPNIINFLLKIISMKDERKQKVSENISKFSNSFRSAIKDKKLLISQLLLSLVIWEFFAIKAYFIAKGLNLDIGFISISVITYLTYMVGMLPLLPGGAGTFEGSMMLFLIPLGVSSDKGMSLAIVFRFVTFWFVFITSALYLGIRYIYNIIKKVKYTKYST
ncbi:protein of unknown function UPF0104 [Gottschalkia purinilytica]|uniref:Phosphatidylglycerol lysyltransferase n=2 Tax=Gottschalkia purinilytica TaxID=1503 RepID=A0A0L0W8T0_GOTPU|nr:protein of unknown function UPF0104 [Gottschalkia purinilytica]